jgi:outer membrane protein OmpA-like peptidoglycan-associated protein
VTATGKLLNESKPVLDEVANILLKNPNVKVEIAGYTDSDGEKKTNLILSQYRADTVRKYLIKKGVNPKNLKAIGYGEANPLVKNNSEKNKQINRRVEFIILGE